MTLLLLAGCLGIERNGTPRTVLTDCGAPDSVEPWSGHPLASFEVSAVPYLETTGIGALREAGAGLDDHVLDGAIVSFVVGEKVWLGGADGSVLTYQVDGLVELDPGTEVDLTVTETLDYFGDLEVVQALGLQVGSEGNAVHVRDASSGSVSYASHAGQVVAYYGEVVGEETGACGDFRCLTVEGAPETASIKVDQDLDPPLALGDCVHVVAPVIWSWDDTRINAEWRELLRRY